MILVAGGSGFIGAAVVRRLVRSGADVSVMTAHPERSWRRIESLGASAVVGDVKVPSTLDRAVEGAEVVVQALTFPTFPVEKASKAFTFEEFDHRGTERLANAAARGGATKYVYASGVGASPDGAHVWYRAKWAGEQAILAAGIAHAIIRPSWVYGPEDRALNRLVTFARRSPVVPMVGDGRQRLQPVFIDDVAGVLAQAASATGPTGIYEIGGPEVMTMRDVLRTMLQVMGKDKPIVPFPEALPKVAGFFAQMLPKPPLSPAAVDFLTGDAVADVDRLLKAFDLTLTPLREGLSTYLGPDSLSGSPRG